MNSRASASRRSSGSCEVTLPSAAWEAGYAAVATQAPDLGYPTADMALGVVTKLLNPILAGRKAGTWNPNTLDWE